MLKFLANTEESTENFSLVRESRGKGMRFQSGFLKKILLNNGV